MAPSNPNTFANNPLDRKSDSRTDDAWIAARLKDPGTLIVPFWKLQPFTLPTPDPA